MVLASRRQANNSSAAVCETAQPTVLASRRQELNVVMVVETNDYSAVVCETTQPTVLASRRQELNVVMVVDPEANDSSAAV